MRLKDHIDESLTFVDLCPQDKDSLLEALVERATSRVSTLDGPSLLTRLRAREQQASTGVGLGIAIPHTTVAGLDRTICLLGQVPAGVTFDSVDGQPVRFVFLLLSPPDSIGTHLRLLARISRIASRDTFIGAVTRASTPGEIHDLVVAEDGRLAE